MCMNRLQIKDIVLIEIICGLHLTSREWWSILLDDNMFDANPRVHILCLIRMQSFSQLDSSLWEMVQVNYRNCQEYDCWSNVSLEMKQIRASQLVGHTSCRGSNIQAHLYGILIKLSGIAWVNIIVASVNEVCAQSIKWVFRFLRLRVCPYLLDKSFLPENVFHCESYRDVIPYAFAIILESMNYTVSRSIILIMALEPHALKNMLFDDIQAIYW